VEIMNLITRDELRAKLHRGDEFKLVMTLSAPRYRAKHIPTSIHFETVAEAFDALDPAEEIVLYCSDVYCAASIYAYRLFERQGYLRVRRYAGGISDWEDAGYPLESGSYEPAPDWSLEEPMRDRRPARRPVRVTTRVPWPVAAS
jgi:rhodanese-related sulfurtransferase